MPAERALDPSEPVMVAWTAYSLTEEYKNSFHWAGMVEHRRGSMWAAFLAGHTAALSAPEPALGGMEELGSVGIKPSREGDAGGGADDALKPCPFCGAPAERIDIAEGENAGGSCISCTACHASSNVEFGFKENFVSNWNRRTAVQALYAVAESLERWLLKDAEPSHISSDDMRVYHLDGGVLANLLNDARAALAQARGEMATAPASPVGEGLVPTEPNLVRSEAGAPSSEWAGVCSTCDGYLTGHRPGCPEDLTAPYNAPPAPAGLASREGWRPIESYDEHGAFPVLVSRLAYSADQFGPAAAFKDAGGTWRVYMSEGGMDPLPFTPTHWMPLPPAPDAHPEVAEMPGRGES